jgi:Raf kinase inhibitor-like YbhB/YbcL family protein
MHRTTTKFLASFAIAAIASTATALASGASLKLKLEEIGPNGTLPAKNASCISAADGRAAPGDNKSPALSWTAGPAGTRSYALTMVDPDVPADLSLLNKEGTTIPLDARRQEFTHWILVDIPVALTRLDEGADGNGLPKGGLKLETTDHGRRGQNGFAVFLNDGPHGGYTGACPPWNDERTHRYRVTVYALDIDRLDLRESFTREDFLKAVKGHVLASRAADYRYTINAKAKR